MLTSIISLAAEIGTVGLVEHALKGFKSCPRRHPIASLCQGVAILFIGMAASDKVGKYAGEKTEEMIAKAKSFVDGVKTIDTPVEDIEPEMEDKDISKEFEEEVKVVWEEAADKED